MAEIIAKTENWDEGLPLGNGYTGSIVYGSRPSKPRSRKALITEIS